MFTQYELNILQRALLDFRGIYGGHDENKLTELEKQKKAKSLEVAEKLRGRIEEIIMDYEYLKDQSAVDLKQER